MKRIVCFLFVILFCLISVAFAQSNNSGAKTKKPVVKKKIVSPFTEAENAWIPFWKDFQTALRDHSKESLKKLIASDIDVSCPSCSDCNQADQREVYLCCEACRFPNDYSDGKWWDGFLGELTKYRVRKINTDKDSREIYRMLDDDYNNRGFGCFARFGYRKDGNWYFTSHYCDSEE
jgi:hypothetical protein